MRLAIKSTAIEDEEFVVDFIGSCVEGEISVDISQHTPDGLRSTRNHRQATNITNSGKQLVAIRTSMIWGKTTSTVSRKYGLSRDAIVY